MDTGSTMTELTPATTQEIAEALKSAQATGKRIELRGAGSKARMGGPISDAEMRVSMTGLHGVLQYEPKDLTISVQAGMRWKELTELLARERQMVPLDPACAAAATVGGVVLTNSAGPRRRLYGTARDMVIGMTYVTMDGAVAQSGGMVVKNVAGLDVQKALIGSFGTLAAVAVINFRVAPVPESTRTFVQSFKTAAGAVSARDRILSSPLQPAALDVLNPAAARGCGLEDWSVALRAGGGPALLGRYQNELGGARVFEGAPEAALWAAIEEFAPGQRYVVKAGHPLAALGAVMESEADRVVSRAATGVTYLGFDSREGVERHLRATAASGWSQVVEWSEHDLGEYWPNAGIDLEWMKKLKASLDAGLLLNRGRLYGRI
ncbi:MAG: FAD-binding oxidoreductase [Acidobacteria bacterium]|nr:FAD-binding oxidoreductase [Acidobacteriota bacterium]